MVFVVQTKNNGPHVINEIGNELLTMKNVNTFTRKTKDKYTFRHFRLLQPKVGYRIIEHLKRQFFYTGIDLLKKLNHPYQWKHEGKRPSRIHFFRAASSGGLFISKRATCV